MAVLSEGRNQYKVRVLRRPQNTYFQEHVKIGERERLDATECDRYIVGEPGQTYAIEIKIGKGFEWGEYDELFVGFYISEPPMLLAGRDLRKSEVTDAITREGTAIVLECVNMTRYIQTGAPFIFRELNIDENLSCETDIIGIDPHSVARFMVRVHRRVKAGLKPKEILEAPPNDHALLQPRTIDPKSFKKYGLTQSTRLDGPRIPCLPPPLKKSSYKYNLSTNLHFNFHYRASDFLQHLGIVPYPPSLHCYTWEQLNGAERKVALEELQRINQGEFRARSGLTPSEDNTRKEWRSWYVMDVGERKYTYEKLQKEHKEYERGEVQTQISMLPAHRFIIIDEDGPAIGQTVSSRNIEAIRLKGISPKIQTRSSQQGTFELDADAPSQVSRKHSRPDSDTHKSTQHVKIKEEPIDIDALQDVILEIVPAPTIKYDSVGPENQRAKRVKFEDIPEDVDMTMLSEIKEEHVSDDGLSDEERREGEMRSDELERQTSIENERARQELAKLLNQAGADIA